MTVEELYALAMGAGWRPVAVEEETHGARVVGATIPGAGMVVIAFNTTRYSVVCRTEAGEILVERGALDRLPQLLALGPLAPAPGKDAN